MAERPVDERGGMPDRALLVAELEELLAATRRNAAELRQILTIVSSQLDGAASPARGA